MKNASAYARLLEGAQVQNTEVVIKFVCICFGGSVGAVSRFGIGELFRVATRAPGWVAILMANLLGCLIIGVAYAGYSEQIHAATLHASLDPRSRLVEFDLHVMMALVVTGFCGGLTTFSSYGLDSILLFQQRKYLQALVNVIVSVVFGVLLVFAGIVLMGGVGL